MKKYDNCHVNIGQEDIESVVAAVTADSISGKGQAVQQLEQALAHFFKVPHTLCCSNATMGIYMILLLEGIGPGDEVLLPPTAPVMTILPILNAGATPVFVDNEPGNFNVCLTGLQQKISDKTRLLINVPMWGYANNIDRISDFCRTKGIKVLEDNSHCHGTRLNDRYLGSFGDYAIFSTHERKLVTTGEGAFFLIRNQADYNRLMELRSFGEVCRTDGEYGSVQGAYGFFSGLNFKMSAINAALGCTQLQKLSAKIKVRQEHGRYLAEQLHQYTDDIREITNGMPSEDNYYSIVCQTSIARRTRIEEALRQSNIISDPLRYRYQPLYKMPLFAPYASSCPNAEALIPTLFSLPVHEGLCKEELDLFLNIIYST